VASLCLVSGVLAKEVDVQSLITHQAWCRRGDSARTGAHESVPVQASAPGDLVGIDATLVQFEADGPQLVRLAITDDNVTTVFCVPTAQARSLHRALGELVAT